VLAQVQVQHKLVQVLRKQVLVLHRLGEVVLNEVLLLVVQHHPCLCFQMAHKFLVGRHAYIVLMYQAYQRSIIAFWQWLSMLLPQSWLVKRIAFSNRQRMQQLVIELA